MQPTRSRVQFLEFLLEHVQDLEQIRYGILLRHLTLGSYSEYEDVDEYQDEDLADYPGNFTTFLSLSEFILFCEIWGFDADSLYHYLMHQSHEDPCFAVDVTEQVLDTINALLEQEHSTKFTFQCTRR